MKIHLFYLVLFNFEHAVKGMNYFVWTPNKHFSNERRFAFDVGLRCPVELEID